MARYAVFIPIVLAALAAPAAADTPPALYGTVGPASNITVSADGFYTGAVGWQPLSYEVDAGTYDIRITDNAGGHNFHLVGPGIDRETSVPETGTFDWPLHLSPGTYTFYCDPHALEMRGTFTVRAPAPATTTPVVTTPIIVAPAKPPAKVTHPKAKPKKKKKKKR